MLNAGIVLFCAPFSKCGVLSSKSCSAVLCGASITHSVMKSGALSQQYTVMISQGNYLIKCQHIFAYVSAHAA